MRARIILGMAIILAAAATWLFIQWRGRGLGSLGRTGSKATAAADRLRRLDKAVVWFERAAESVRAQTNALVLTVVREMERKRDAAMLAVIQEQVDSQRTNFYAAGVAGLTNYAWFGPASYLVSQLAAAGIEAEARNTPVTQEVVGHWDVFVRTSDVARAREILAAQAPGPPPGPAPR